MKLFSFAAFSALAGALIADEAGRLTPGAFVVDRFAGGELHVELQTPVAGVDCAVLGTLRPPERHLGEFLLVCDTLRRHGARSVLAILPYFAYARQDRLEAGRSLGAAWVGELLRASGVTQVLTLDVHSPLAQALCPIPMTSADTGPLVLHALGRRLDADVTLVAPDEGALERCRKLRDLAVPPPTLAHFKKIRTQSGVTSSLVGPVRERAVVFDDILDTGGTLVACAEGLRAAGVRHIVIAVSHGLFTGESWRQLWDLGIEHVIVTDSVGEVAIHDRRIEVVSCAPALLAALRRPEEVSRAHA